eukprot:3241163-Pyramimonas_sp.AAC.1
MTSYAARLSSISANFPQWQRRQLFRPQGQIRRNKFCFNGTVGHTGLSTRGHALVGPRAGCPNHLTTGTSAAMRSQAAGNINI